MNVTGSAPGNICSTWGRQGNCYSSTIVAEFTAAVNITKNFEFVD